MQIKILVITIIEIMFQSLIIPYNKLIQLK
jgi:hypothetical protein